MDDTDRPALSARRREFCPCTEAAVAARTSEVRLSDLKSVS